MGSNRRKRLAHAVAVIQRRWGIGALRRGAKDSRQRVDASAISTTFSSLDHALRGSGGIPRGRLTEITGAPTTGMTTLALKTMAQAVAEGDNAVYLDLNHTFDPDYAARCGVDLSRLLIARPKTQPETLSIIIDLIADRGIGILVVNPFTDLLSDASIHPYLSAMLRRLPGLLAKSPCAAIFLTPQQFPNQQTVIDNSSLAPYAALRLLVEKEQWINKLGDIRGYRAQVTVVKNKLGRAGQKTTIAITFNGTVRGDST